jgi:hypothetical protein
MAIYAKNKNPGRYSDQGILPDLNNAPREINSNWKDAHQSTSFHRLKIKDYGYKIILISL